MAPTVAETNDTSPTAQVDKFDSNESLVDYLWSQKSITRPVVREVFLKVDRGNFAPRNAYENRPQVLSYQSTISAPHMHAKSVELLLPYILPCTDERHRNGTKTVIGIEGRPRRILDIGSGSGFLVQVFAELVDERGIVVGVEHVEELRQLGETNLRKSPSGAAFLDSKRVRFSLGDGRKGWPDRIEDPLLNDDDGWDAIHVGAAAVHLPCELVRQLRRPGRLFIPIREGVCNCFPNTYIWIFDKDEEGNVTETKICQARFVSLMDAPLHHKMSGTQRESREGSAAEELEIVGNQLGQRDE